MTDFTAEPLRQGDIVVFRLNSSLGPDLSDLIFYVRDLTGWGGRPSLRQITSTRGLGWVLGAYPADLEVVGHVDHEFPPFSGDSFDPEEMPLFAEAIAEALRRGYPLSPGLYR